MDSDEIIEKALQQATGEPEVSLEIPENPEHGDYTSNVAMQLKTQKSNVKPKTQISKLEEPREIAKEIVSRLEKDKNLAQLVDRIEIAGPGFINLWLSQEVLVANLNEILKLKEDYSSSNEGKNKTILVEYSSPNIAKHFGIGHLRSTIIGQSIYNLYKFLGYKAVGENHLGDWGTQFGTLLAQIAKTQNSKLKIQNFSVAQLQQMYVEFNKQAESDPKLWDEARAWFKKLEDGDPEARKIWETVRELSIKEFDRIYTRLGIKIDHAHGESYFEDKMSSIVKEATDKGLAKKGEKGALIIELSGMPPGMFVKSDGATTYFNRDLAALKYRIDTWKPDKIVYEVGSDQTLHFRQVFEAAKKLGWIKKGRPELVHIAHGLIRFKEGKMSTRKGTTVNLEKVLDEAVKRAQKYNKDKKVSEAVGIGAIKYFDLKHAPTSDIIFDWDKVFVLEGNSGPYLQYTFARTQSVLAKFKAQSSKVKTTSNSSKLGRQISPLSYSFDISDLTFELNSEEVLLLRSFIHFHAVIQIAAKNYSPNILCTYLFQLAQKYNSFYNKHRIIGSKNQKLRIMITAGTGQVIKNGLTILGIGTPAVM